MEESFLTVAEIAELLKVNQQSVKNWIDRGELSAVRVGQRRVRVRRTDLDRFLEAGRMDRATESPEQGHHIPSSPDDPTPGCTVELTKAQLDRVQELDPDHTVEIERRGGGWVRLRVFSPDGEVFQEADLPPT